MAGEKITDGECLRPSLVDKILLERLPLTLQHVPFTGNDSPVTFCFHGKNPFLGDDDMVDVPDLGYEVMHHKISRWKFLKEVPNSLFGHRSAARVQGSDRKSVV